MILALLFAAINAEASYTCKGAFGEFTLESITKNTFKSTLDGKLDRGNGQPTYSEKKDKLIYYVNNGCDNDMTFRVPTVVVEALENRNNPFLRFAMNVDYLDPDQVFLGTEVVCTLDSVK